MFAKLPPLQPERRAVIAGTGMAQRETQFYEHLAPLLKLRTPLVHATSFDPKSGDFAMLLEDIETTGCTVPDGTVGVTPDAAAVALAELAELHVRYEDPALRKAEAGWVTGPHFTDYAVRLLRHGIDHHRDRLTDAFVEVAEIYSANQRAIQDLWHAGPQTVIHNDTHLGNVFDDHGRIGFLDWGVVVVSTPMRDASYFLTMAMDIEDRRRHERVLLQHYLDARRALGGVDFSFDEAWAAHRLESSYTVVASCQIVGFPTDITERRRIFSEAFLARSSAAVEDLEAAQALRERGI